MSNDNEKPLGRIVIAGGSGFLGTSLAAYLTERGAEVVVLTRGKAKVRGAVQHIHWDARTLSDWQNVLDGATALVNLAGRSVDCIKSPDHRDEILRSRVEATRVLGQAVRNVANPPPVWIQMSTAHIYGDPPELTCTEDSPLGCGLAPHVGRAWEEAFRASVLPNQRGVVLRTSFVNGRNRGAGAGALDRLRTVVRLGLGGRVGTGRQGISWIHEHDLNRIVERAILNPAMHGAYIASSPNPVPQVDFMRALRRTMRMPIGLPASAWMVRLGAHYLLRTDPELALYGRYVIPQRLLNEGFEFCFGQIHDALREALATPPTGKATSAAVP
jgi:uncharacterized protein (TIGR01777 family)